MNNIQKNGQLSEPPIANIDHILASNIPKDFKETFVNLKNIATQQHKELQSMHIRTTGITTISNSLKEEREENLRLRNKIGKLEEFVSNVRNQVHSKGDSSLESVSPQSSGGFSVGSSKQVLDNLVQENLKLREQLKNLVKNPHKVQQLESNMEELKLKLQESQQKCAQATQDITKLKRLLESSPDEKDREIHRLRSVLEQWQKTKEDSEGKCQSMSEESIALRQQLKGLAETCQHLARKLEERDRNQKVEEGVQRMSFSSGSSTDSGLSEECAALRIKNADQDATIQKLSKQLNELLETNTKWQNYDKERETYMQKLQGAIKEMEHRISSMGQSQITEEQQQEIDRIIQAYKKKVEGIEEEKNKIEDENRTIRQQNQEMQSVIDNMQRQLTSNQNSAGQMSPADRDRIHVLEAQIQICTEDFESERKDREKAQSKVVELERENDLIKRQLEQFQVSHMTRLHNQRMQTLAHYQNQYNQQQSFSNHPRLISRGIEGNVVADCDDDIEDEDTIDSLPRSGDAVSHDDITSSIVPDNSLQCPKCKQEYTVEQHSEFLEHIDSCCS